MTRGGRPFRFLGCFAAIWIGARILLLWPAAPLPEAIEALVPGAAPALAAPAPQEPVAAPLAAPAIRRPTTAVPVHGLVRMPSNVLTMQMPMMAAVSLGGGEPVMMPPPVAAPSIARLPPLPDRMSPLPDRWSASAWAVVRPGAGLGVAPGSSQIGGSQAGLRIAWLVSRRARVAGFGRVVAPLAGEGSEAALGIEWQPIAAPVRIAVEHRFGLDGVRGGPGIGLVGGYDGRGPAGFRLESYGQAGVIVRDRSEPYADGAIRATRVVAGRGALKLALGAGVWGAAQRDAQRLDIGPVVTLAVPVGKQQVRLALDWRQRVAGGARPGSGVALTLGADF